MNNSMGEYQGSRQAMTSQTDREHEGASIGRYSYRNPEFLLAMRGGGVPVSGIIAVIEKCGQQDKCSAIATYEGLTGESITGPRGPFTPCDGGYEGE